MIEDKYDQIMRDIIESEESELEDGMPMNKRVKLTGEQIKEIRGTI